MHFGDGLVREQATLDGADELLFVGRRNFSGGFGVEPLQHTMQMTGRMLFDARTEPFAQFFGALRNLGKALKKRSQIQSGANCEYRQPFALPQVLKNLQSKLAVAPGFVVILRTNNVDQMMVNAGEFS